ncbi:MAG TPA: hypothetical protein VEM38_09110 [Burkholderiales bacterium]|nr:hypothetical protein [Burkholderiales bacterium]
MKRMLAVTLCAAAAAPAFAADVGVSVEISQPGVYGRIDIGRFPTPQVIVPQPVIILPPGVVVGSPVQPIYMWVPPGHRKNWAKHCDQYRACGVPVYFVRHDWYDREVRGPRESRGDDRERGREERGRGRDDRGHGHEERERGRDDRGHGKGQGRDRD